MIKWDIKKKKFLSENYSKMEVSEISKVIGIEKKRIYTMASLMKLKRKRSDIWSKDEIEFLKIHKGIYSPKEFSEILNKDICSIKFHLRKIRSKR